MTVFYSLYPVVSLFYFISVLSITMFSANPMLLCFGLLGGLLFFIKCQKRITAGELGFNAVLFFAVVITNPLFSHKGVTILFFINSNPVTLEAILYGVNMGIMLLGVVYWFKCFNSIMTDDKLLFLFGKISPKLSLILSSALRFIPLLKTQSEKIRQAQKSMGLFASDTWTDKLKGTVRVYSALITWGLENAIDTGSSMKARGYGLKGRSHYSLFRFERSDCFISAVIILLDIIVIIALISGRLDFSFYPSVKYPSAADCGFSAITAFALLCLLPVILEVGEGLKWKYCKSKI